MDIKAITLADMNLVSFLSSVVRAVPFFFYLVRFIKENNIKLIHVNMYRIGVPYSVAAKIAGVPVIWHIREIATSKLRRWAVKFSTVLMADIAIAISEAAANVLKSDSPEVRVIYNGVDIEPFLNADEINIRRELGIKISSPLIGNVGQFIPLKGQEFLVRSFADVVKEIPEARLLLVGYNVSTVWNISKSEIDYGTKVRNLVRQLDLEKNVVFLGFRDDIASVMKALDIYVHASILPEPFGRVLVEAMGAGKPVIAPFLGGIPEIVEPGKNGLLYTAGDVDALAKDIVHLLKNKARRIEMGEKGEKIARQKFSVEAYVSQIEAIYFDLLN